MQLGCTIILPPALPGVKPAGRSQRESGSSGNGRGSRQQARSGGAANASSRSRAEDGPII